METNLAHGNNMRDYFYNLFVLNEVKSTHSISNSENITNTYVDDSNSLGLDYESDYIEDETNLLIPETG